VVASPYQGILKIQIGPRQVFEYQDGGMPFGLGGLALIVVYVTVELQAILKPYVSCVLSTRLL
jgi:hypothetical protein